MVRKYRQAKPVTKLRTITLALLVSLLASATQGQTLPPPTRYKVVDLSTLIGFHRDGTIPDISLNRQGQVMGQLEYNDPKTTPPADRSFVWRDGKITWLPPLLGYSDSVAHAQNQSGWIVGQVRRNSQSINSQNIGNGAAACEWVHGKPHLLKTGHPGTSVAMAINARGDVVGGYTVQTAQSHADHACLWKHGGGFLDLGPVAGLPARKRGTGWVATNINDNGQILGYVLGAVTNQAGPTWVFWEKGHARRETPQDNQRMTGVTNRRGQRLRGSTLVSGGKATSLLWKGKAAYGSDLNDFGDVVGGLPADKLKLSPWAQRSDYDYHAFLYRAGRMYDLNDLVPSRTGEVLTDALNIDNAGRILVRDSHKPLLLVPIHN
jgi:probable HAF family extracellular repeat protein